MTIKRNSSTKNNPKIKKSKTNFEETMDYTELLTSENVEELETGDDAGKPKKIKFAKKSKIIKKNEPKNTMDYTELLTSENVEKIETGDDAGKPEKIKLAKKSKIIKKNEPKTDKDKKLSKKSKGKPTNKTDDKPTEKPNWKEYKKEKQELLLKRKQQKCKFFETLQKAKKLWESVRREDCPIQTKETQLDQLYAFSKPHLETMVYSHDTARIVQWMLKLGSPEIRSQVINDLLKHVPKMLNSTYASLCVKTMLTKGDTEQRKIIINSLKGKFYVLALRTNAVKILDMMYTTYATTEQQNLIMHELYGASSILCESPNVLSLSDVLKNSPNTKDIILAKTKDHIKKFVLKQKNSMQTTLVHNLIYEYILYTGGKDCDELLASLKEFPIELFYTSKSGCHIAMYILWSSTPKDKKAILKQIKTTSATCDLATSEYGYLILLALLDSVDDTVVVKKTIIPDILKNMEKIANNEYGRKVILFLVAWKDSSYFHPHDIELLKKKNTFKECKKDDYVRVKELLNAVSDHFLQHIQENTKFWLSSGSIAMVLLGILKSGSGEKLKDAMTSIANYLVEPSNEIKDKEKKVPLYEHASLHMVLKKIIGHDKILVKRNEATFSEILSSVITEDMLESWVQCNRACFLLIALIESNVDLAVKNIKSLLTPKIITLVNQQLHSSGAKILATKLNP